MELTTGLEMRAREIRQLQAQEDMLAAKYVASDPLGRHNDYFVSAAESLYPKYPAGVIMENNVGDNQTRYNLTVSIEGKDSDGINAARILCFDWLLLQRGSNHTMDFLWHDNRLFAHLDPRPRAEWFRLVLNGISMSGKQYLASINTENFAAMRPHLSADELEQLNSAIALTLRGDRPANKLLGVQFGS